MSEAFWVVIFILIGIDLTCLCKEQAAIRGSSIIPN